MLREHGEALLADLGEAAVNGDPLGLAGEGAVDGDLAVRRVAI